MTYPPGSPVPPVLCIVVKWTSKSGINDINGTEHETLNESRGELWALPASVSGSFIIPLIVDADVSGLQPPRPFSRLDGINRACAQSP